MSDAITRFEEFWRRLPLTNTRPSEWVHPADDEYLTERDRTYMQLDLLPLPVNGNLRNAKVVILMLNPGFGERDAAWGTPSSRSERLGSEIANLRQIHKSSDYPMHELNPILTGSGGARFWAGSLGKTGGKLRHLAKALAPPNDEDHIEIRKELSNHITVVQLVAYRSTKFSDLQGGQRKEGPPQHRLQSSKEALLLAQSLIEEQDKLVVVPYGIQHWGLETQVTSRLIVYRRGLRAANFTPISPGHHVILKTLSRRNALLSAI